MVNKEKLLTGGCKLSLIGPGYVGLPSAEVAGQPLNGYIHYSQ